MAMSAESEYEHVTPLTASRRDYILRHMARNKGGGAWIRISDQELADFGGWGFFSGLEITRMHDGKWFLTTQKNGFDLSPRRKVQLAIRIEVPVGGWTPPTSGAWWTNTTSSTITINAGSSTWASGSQPSKGKTVREHHINRETLLGVVRENQEKYATAYTRFKALYADEVEALTQKHLDGLIPTSSIVVRDKDNNAITILTDMSKTFDDQLRELELDDREVVVLDHEEYGLFVEGYATNLKQVEETAKKLEELQ